MEIDDLESELEALNNSEPAFKPKPRQAPAQASPWDQAKPSGPSAFGNASNPSASDEVGALRPFSPGDDGSKALGGSAPQPQAPAYSAPSQADKAMDLLKKIENRADQQKGRTSAATRPQNSNPSGPQAVGATQGAYDAQGAAPPVLNEVKMEFTKRRWLQTMFGGPRCLFGESRPKLSLVVFQWFLWVYPVAVGLPFSLLSCPEVAPQCLDRAGTMDSPLGPMIAGTIVGTIHCLLQLLRSRFREQVAPQGAQADKGKGGLAALADEDDYQDVNFFSARGWAFLMPYRGFTSILYGWFVGFLVGVAGHYLSPDYVKYSLNGASDAEAAAVYAVGWYVVGLAAYSINGHPPPEPNAYYSDDANRLLGPCSRGIHCLLVMGPAAYANAWAHPISIVLLAILPLFWAFGSLPSGEVLLEWAGEQGLIYLHGGSATASFERLVVSLILTWGGIGLCYFLTTEVSLWLGLMVAGVFGFVLSHDTILAPSHMGLYAFGKGTTVTATTFASGNVERAVKWLVLVLLIALPVTLHGMEKDKAGLVEVQGLAAESATIRPILDIVLIAGCVLTAISAHLQRPYLFGLLANPIRKGAKDLGTIGWLKIIYWASLWLGRVAVIAYVYCYSMQNNAGIAIGYPTKAEIVWHQLTVSRALRRVWQCPGGAVMEAGVTALLNMILGDSCGDYCTKLQPCDQFLIVGFCIARLSELWEKTRFGAVLILTSWTDTKQRARYAGTTLCILLFTFPLSLGILLASALLSAPLLPLLGVPLFLIGFPRSRRHWPASEGAQTSALDAAYYKLMAPQVAHQFVRACEAGAFGPSVVGGEHFLVRKDAFLIMVQVLERGYGYTIVNIKGMELQETSCHHVEAGAVESIMDSALGDCTESGKAPALPAINPYLWHCLDPVLKVKLQTYTLGDNQLTGIIDSPDLISQIPKTLTYSLLWILNAEKLKDDGVPTSWFDFKEFMTLGTPITSPAAGERYPSKWADSIRLYQPKPQPIVAQEVVQVKPVQSQQQVAADPGKPASNQVVIGAAPVQSPTSVTVGASTPLNISQPQKEETGGSHSKSITIGGPEPVVTHTPQESSSTAINQPKQSTAAADLEVDDLEDLDDLLDEMENSTIGGTKFGTDLADPTFVISGSRSGNVDAESSDNEQGVKAAAELCSPIPTPLLMVGGKHFGADDDADALLEELEDLAAPEASKLNDSTSTKPRSDVVTPSTAPAAPSPAQSKPQAFGTTEAVAAEIGGGAARLTVADCKNWVAACYGIVEEWGHSTSKEGADHTILIYSGDLPSSSEARWLEGRPGLKEAIVKAFRYAFKFQYDVMLYGLDDTPEGMKSAFEEYDKEWYFGPENGTGWAEAVESGTKNLMAIWKDKGVCRSRVATTVDSSFQVARLNNEAVRGLWASLGMELYYFTNDDDERYSIQANTNLLRNLMVQAAAPPLGYPLFISPVTAAHSV